MMLWSAEEDLINLRITERKWPYTTLDGFFVACNDKGFRFTGLRGFVMDDDSPLAGVDTFLARESLPAVE